VAKLADALILESRILEQAPHMADDPTNIVREHLRAMRGDMHEMKDMLREHGHRLTRIEISIASLRREQASDAGSCAFGSSHRSI
jgi:hypothetical protein